MNDAERLGFIDHGTQIGISTEPNTKPRPTWHLRPTSLACPKCAEPLFGFFTPHRGEPRGVDCRSCGYRRIEPYHVPALSSRRGKT